MKIHWAICKSTKQTIIEKCTLQYYYWTGEWLRLFTIQIYFHSLCNLLELSRGKRKREKETERIRFVDWDIFAFSKVERWPRYKETKSRWIESKFTTFKTASYFVFPIIEWEKIWDKREKLKKS